MGSSLYLQIAARLVCIQLSRERLFNVPWPCVMSFNQVAVIGIHDPNQVGQTGGGSGMKCAFQFGRSRR